MLSLLTPPVVTIATSTATVRSVLEPPAARVRDMTFAPRTDLPVWDRQRQCVVSGRVLRVSVLPRGVVLKLHGVPAPLTFDLMNGESDEITSTGPGVAGVPRYYIVDDVAAVAGTKWDGYESVDALDMIGTVRVGDVACVMETTRNQTVGCVVKAIGLGADSQTLYLDVIASINPNTPVGTSLPPLRKKGTRIQSGDGEFVVVRPFASACLV